VGLEDRNVSFLEVAMRRTVFAVLALVSVSSSIACGSAPEPLPALNAADGGASAAPSAPADPRAEPEGGTLAPQPAPPAPETKADEVTEAFGIFVAKHGAAQNPGTRKSPLESITEAIAKAKAAKKRVFVCEGTYEESLELVDGVSIVGGLDCSEDTWKLSDKKSTLTSPTSPAIRATNIATPTRVDGFDVTSPDATEPSGSSIAVIVVDSKALTFAKGSIKAGTGMKGDDGVEGEQLNFTAGWPAERGAEWQPTAQYPTQHMLGGAGAIGRCSRPNGETFAEMRGGFGSSSGTYTRANANVPWTVMSAPRSGADPTHASPTMQGVDGASGVLGSFDATGYLPADGVAGTSGSVGRGGWGGFYDTIPPQYTAAYGYAYGAVMAGGGVGGCPGLAGTPGKGGGASVAVLTLRSPIRFDSMTLVASAGGSGGRGTLGSAESAGTIGGYDGSAQMYSKPGERGGRAGVSGNGAGGPSFAIAHEGGAPVLSQSKTEVGEGGAGVDARSSGMRNLPASAAGEALAVKAL